MSPARETAARVAVVVPIRNEARLAAALAGRLRALADGGAEVVVVDGESTDDGLARLTALAPSVRVVAARRGRGRQMNAGARATRAPILLFLHADTTLPPGALAQVVAAVDDGAGFGCFRVRIDSRDLRLRAAARLINLRSRLLPSATGDQAIFVRRDLFDAAGGFREVALCEDLELVRRLARRARFRVLDAAVLTSARRWETGGALRTIGLLWCLRAAWHLGVPERLLARLYGEAR